MFSTAEAILCGNYTPLGQVQIGPIDSLGGQLAEYQIPSGIISTLKLADLAVTVAKLGLSSVIDSKVAAGAGIVESKLALIYGTQALHDDIQTRILAATYLAHDHSLTDPTQVDHANLLNVLANQHHPQGHTLASHSTKAHSELTDVNPNDHHALNLAISSPDVTATASEVNTVADGLTAKNSHIHDDRYYTETELSAIQKVPHATLWSVANGAQFSDCFAFGSIHMPQADADCTFSATIKIPSSWGQTTAKITILYSIDVALTAYLIKWNVNSRAQGEIINSMNILNNIADQFDQLGSAWALGLKQKSISGIANNDLLGICITSRSAGNPRCYVMDAWIEQ